MNPAAAFLADRFSTLSRITFADGTTNQAWIQVAVCGTFHSDKYGIITITPDDLRVMMRNYQTEHPIAPTELMLDYEHLSANPQNPRDGESAGWFKSLALRNDDKELWALVELTDDAANSVRQKKYRYISPEIARRYTSKKNGRNVGMCLKAAALTNRPFLEGMEPVSLQLSDARGRTLDVAIWKTEQYADVADLPYSDRERRVREAINLKYPPSYGPDGVQYDSYVWVRDVYDDRVVFSKGSSNFAIAYTFNDDLSITFEGDAYEVLITDTPVLAFADPDVIDCRPADVVIEA